MGAPFVRSSPHVIQRMLTLAGVNSQTVLYDLGCGDGAIVLSAVRDHNVRKAVGIEYNHKLYRIAVSKTSGFKNAVIIEGNYDSVNISEASVVTIYQGRHENERLKRKLVQELSDGSTVVCHEFGVPKWRPKNFEVGRDGNHSYRIFSYVMGFHTPL